MTLVVFKQDIQQNPLCRCSHHNFTIFYLIAHKSIPLPKSEGHILCVCVSALYVQV